MMPFPNLFVAGPPRTGTTSVARWLGGHDAIVISRPKEPGYHCADLPMRDRITDRDTYVAAFRSRGTETYLAEATPWYLYSETAAASIYEMAPDARIIIMLRRPVEALASLHNHHVFVGIEDESDFERAVFGRRPPADPRDFRYDLDYLSVYRLAPQVERFCQRFARDQIVFVDFDQLRTDPRDTHLEMLKRLDVEVTPLDEYPHLNKGRHLRSSSAQRVLSRVTPQLPKGRLRGSLERMNVVQGREKPSPELQQRILDALEDDIVALEQLIDRDLSTWRAIDR